MARQGDAGVPADAGPDAGPIAGAPAPAPSAPPAQPTLKVSNDTYTDTAAASHKNIKFEATIPTSLTKTNYAFVNQLKGYEKSGSGSFFKVTMYGSLVDFNFPSWQVDSVDPDPVYWSDTSARWNYNTTPTGFTATDDPGPALSSEHGAKYAVHFKIGLYKLADLPTTTTGTISAKPIAEQPWEYSVDVSSTGTFSHP
jgi:hypothetical protein